MVRQSIPGGRTAVDHGMGGGSININCSTQSDWFTWQNAPCYYINTYTQIYMVPKIVKTNMRHWMTRR